MGHSKVNGNDSWVVGSAPDCDLIVREPAVSGHHCVLTRENGSYWVEDLQSTNGTFVNGTRLVGNGRIAVAPGSRVTLGQHALMPWPQSGGPAANGHPHGEVVTIGRSPEADIQIDLPMISWEHARILVQNGRYTLEDLHSSNGTSIDQVGNRIQRAPLDPGSDVFLGSFRIPASKLLAGRKVGIGPSAFQKVQFKSSSMTLGRDPQSDVPLAYPMISWHHARLTRVPEGVLVEDLGSRNGTFVGGVRVSGKAVAKPGQEIGLGSFRFQLLDDGQLAQREYYGNLTIEAREVAVNAPSGRRLIEPISLTIFPSELVAVMGGAGAGKTTFLKSLNGYTPPASGQVLFNGQDLYAFYDQFRQQMGYVPQDEIVHPQLKVWEALFFSARLRTDLRDEEIHARIKDLLKRLEIWDKRDDIIGSPENKVLSGGQRKRVNVALELIVDTPVLFLDEPTSGLSSYDAESMVELLKELSREGKTVITTIHQPSLKIYKQFDDLLMINRDKEANTGAMVFFGPAYPDAIRFFHEPVASPEEKGAELSPEMLLSSLPRKKTADWLGLYQRSRYQREFVDSRSGQQPSGAKKGNATAGRSFGLPQWIALVKRNVIVKKRDKLQLAILLIQAPLFALLICVIYPPLSAEHYVELTPKLVGAHFLMVIATIWFGCNNAARDIVGEWTIYRRERMVTLNIGAYVFSKFAVLFVLCLVQCLCLLGIVYVGLGLKSNFGLDLLVLMTAALIGTGLGLCISAYSRTTESAIAMLPVVLLPILALGGGMRPTYKIKPAFRWITAVVPSRWAFEANLLQEARSDGWLKPSQHLAEEEMPDLTDPTQARQSTAEQREQFEAETQARSPRPRSNGTAARRSPAVDPQESPSRILRGDVAELYFPHRLITWKQADETHIARAFAGEDKSVGSEHYAPEDFRHPLKTSLTVLWGMLLLTLVGVVAILYRRDRDPQ